MVCPPHQVPRQCRGPEPADVDMLDVNSIEGRANVNLDLLGVGSSVDGIMKSLSGTAGFNVDSGRWTGLDLDRLLRSGDTTSGTTVFDNLSASSTLKNGVASNDDLILAFRLLKRAARGRLILAIAIWTIRSPQTQNPHVQAKDWQSLCAFMDRGRRLNSNPI